MFLLRGHAHATLIGTFKSVNSGRFLPSLISCVRYIHTDKDDTSSSNVKTDGLYEIYKGKKRKLVFDKDSHSIQRDRGSLLSSDSLSFRGIKNTIKRGLIEIFLPKGYPDSVNGRFVHYCLLSCIGMGFSLAGGVLSTQSMLFAAGMGAAAAPMAAALNWVLKDGIGQFGGVAFTAFVNSRLDADSRGWRILAAWILEVSTWLEVVTPLFPSHFLLLATLANIGKNIAWLAISATRAGINYGFVKAHNMSDITAKEASQLNCVTVFGTFLGISLSKWIGMTRPELVLMTSFCLSALSIGSVLWSLRTVSLPTINYQRGELMTSHYLRTGEIISPQQVASLERYFIPYLKPKGSEKRIPIVVGVPIQTTLSIAPKKEDCDSYLQLFADRPYILSICEHKQGIYRALVNREGRRQKIVGVSLRENASSEDEMSAYYHAHLLRQELERLDRFDVTFQQQVELIHSTMKYADESIRHFKKELVQGGWSCDDLFLEEKSQRYSLLIVCFMRHSNFEDLTSLLLEDYRYGYLCLDKTLQKGLLFVRYVFML